MHVFLCVRVYICDNRRLSVIVYHFDTIDVFE